MSTRSKGYITHRELLFIKEQWEDTYHKIQMLCIPKRHKYYSNVQEFLRTYQQLDNIIDEQNEIFITEESQKCNSLLSDIGGKSLDAQQRRVVVTDEDRNLVIAGAGSGKTLTIVGKVKYLCEEKHSFSGFIKDL